MEMKNTFVELEQFEELTPEVLKEVNGGGIFEDAVKWCDKLFSTGRHFAQIHSIR